MPLRWLEGGKCGKGKHRVQSPSPYDGGGGLTPGSCPLVSLWHMRIYTYTHTINTCVEQFLKILDFFLWANIEQQPEQLLKINIHEIMLFSTLAAWANSSVGEMFVKQAMVSEFDPLNLYYTALMGWRCGSVGKVLVSHARNIVWFPALCKVRHGVASL